MQREKDTVLPDVHMNLSVPQTAKADSSSTLVHCALELAFVFVTIMGWSSTILSVLGLLGGVYFGLQWGSNAWVTPFLPSSSEDHLKLLEAGKQNYPPSVLGFR